MPKQELLTRSPSLPRGSAAPRTKLLLPSRVGGESGSLKIEIRREFIETPGSASSKEGRYPGRQMRRLKIKSDWRIVLKKLTGQVIIILIINAIIPLASLSILCLDLPGLNIS